MRKRGLAALTVVIALTWSVQQSASGQAEPSSDTVVEIFRAAAIQWDRELVDGMAVGDYLRYDQGHTVQRTIELPKLPRDQRDARRIIATVVVEPEITQEQPGKYKPCDPWTRLGSVSVVLPEKEGQKKPPATTEPKRDQPTDQATTQPTSSFARSLNEVELIRFITGFGGPMTFEQDVTALAPLLSGKSTLRVSISTYKSPAWKVSLSLRYTDEAVGYRRPAWARLLFNQTAVTSSDNKLKATINVPEGLSRPRLWIISTGHATDGTGGDEFISRTHILKVDGQEVARWRPWAEEGGRLREKNPMSGRMLIDGRELWSSDIDRSGWHPASMIEPVQIPVPELTPGRHTIQLEIVGIRPKDASGYGYWRTSVVAVADEPWPDEDR